MLAGTKLLSFLFSNRKIATISRIPVILSGQWIVFVILMAITVLVGNPNKKGLIDALCLMMYVSSVYLVVVLHEFGHAFTMQYYGYECRSITIYPFMGLATADEIPAHIPKIEFFITIFGPLVNLILTVALFPFCHYNNFLKHLYEVNVGMAVFNLIPIYPMDGGRILRSILTAFFKDSVRSTKWAYRVSWFCGPILAAVSFFFSFYIAGILLLIMPLLAFGEKKAIQYKAELEDCEKILRTVKEEHSHIIEESLSVN